MLGVPTPEVNLTAFDNAQPSELSTLVNSTGITLFAPWNGAISNALASGELWNHTRAEIVNVIANHFVQPGTVVSFLARRAGRPEARRSSAELTSFSSPSQLYSTNLTDGSSATSASGQVLRFINNSTGGLLAFLSDKLDAES